MREGHNGEKIGEMEQAVAMLRQAELKVVSVFFLSQSIDNFSTYINVSIVQLGLKLNTKLGLNHPPPGTFQRLLGIVGG